MLYAAKKKLPVILVAMLIVMIAFVFSAHDNTAYAASSTGVITSVTNVASGIKVSWSKDSSKTGYYIYRKVGTGSWKKVKTIEKNTTIAWTDKNVKNGKKYSYKVRAYKGKTIASTTKNMYTFRLIKPKVSSLSTPGPKKLTIKSSSNSKATGFQVRYSKSSTFSKSSTVNVKGTRVNKTLSSLANRMYYVKVRAYKTYNNNKYYSAWSDVKSKNVYKYAYTIHNSTRLRKYARTETSNEDINVWYRTKLKDLGPAKVTKTGTWQKYYYSYKYNGKIYGSIYYLWKTSDDPKTTYTAPKTNYTSSNKYRKAVLKKALDIYKNWKTKYDRTGVDKHETPDDEGRYAFDCSGFTSYVLEQVLTQYCPAYEVTTNIAKQGNLEVILNEGFDQELRVITTTKKLDFNKLSPGDLLFFNTDSDEDADHVGFYLGNKEFIHSTQSYKRHPKDYLKDGKSTVGGVCISSLEGYEKSFMFAKRFAPDSFDNTTINKKMVAIKMIRNIYSNSGCNKNIEGESISKNEIAVLLYTIRVYRTDGSSYIAAYVKYGENLDKYGYISGYESKFEDYVEPPVEPEPEDPENPDPENPENPQP